MKPIATIVWLSATALLALPAHAQFDLSWNTIDGGGGTSTGGTLSVSMTIGQPDAGTMTGGTLVISGGFWVGAAAATCYANCDNSSVAPVLTANDFQCFLNRFAALDPYANCDGSSVAPLLNANDFQCFLNACATGCS